MTPSRAAAALVVAVVVGLGAPGCGGGDERADPDPPGGPTTAPASEGPGAPSAPEGGAPPTEAAARTPLPGFGEVEVRVVDGPDGEPVVLCVLLAETPEQRARGLMEVTDLGGYDGMLFAYPDDHEGGFWMRDTVLPLSIAYLDADGRVVSTADMEPCPDGGPACPTYPPAGPYRDALEVPRGGLDALGLVEGSPARLEVGGTCPPPTS